MFERDMFLKFCLHCGVLFCVVRRKTDSMSEKIKVKGEGECRVLPTFCERNAV